MDILDTHISCLDEDNTDALTLAVTHAPSSYNGQQNSDEAKAAFFEFYADEPAQEANCPTPTDTQLVALESWLISANKRAANSYGTEAPFTVRRIANKIVEKLNFADDAKIAAEKRAFEFGAERFLVELNELLQMRLTLAGVVDAVTYRAYHQAKMGGELTKSFVVQNLLDKWMLVRVRELNAAQQKARRAQFHADARQGVAA